MSKLFLLAIIGLAIAGVVTGALEVRVHPEKMAGLPAVIGKTLGTGSLVSQGEYYLTTWKRKAEIALASSDDKKFEVYVRHVEKDTASLKTALDAKKEPDAILVRSKLLNESLGYAKEAVEDISDEALKNMRDNWVKVLSNANHELGRLTGLADEYKKYQEEIEKIAPSPEASPKIELKF